MTQVVSITSLPFSWFFWGHITLRFEARGRQHPSQLGFHSRSTVRNSLYDISRKRIYTHPNHELHFHLRWRVYTRDSSSFFLRLLKTGYIHIQVIVHQPPGSFDFSHSLVIFDQYFQQFVSPVEFVSSLTQLEGTQCNSSGERIYGRKTHINLSNNHWSIDE